MYYLCTWVSVDGGTSLTQLTSETADDSDQEQHHSGSQSLSQKVWLLCIIALQSYIVAL